MYKYIIVYIVFILFRTYFFKFISDTYDEPEFQ